MHIHSSQKSKFFLFFWEWSHKLWNFLKPFLFSLSLSLSLSFYRALRVLTLVHSNTALCNFMTHTSQMEANNSGIAKMTLFFKLLQKYTHTHSERCRNRMNKKKRLNWIRNANSNLNWLMTRALYKKRTLSEKQHRNNNGKK
jgi:hypothetical protein